MKRISLSTHVLDTARGRPVESCPVVLERREGDAWVAVGIGRTDIDGRIPELIPDGDAAPGGRYRVTFDLESTPTVADGWYPEVSIVVNLADGSGHSHVPLLLAPFGFSTYRGS
ncbi:MAG: hydroxyisourate hydrolase [Solirubrobacteraceae bacterium]|nr:hydroxyisourate hydrolase [Patulibacter sp.]